MQVGTRSHSFARFADFVLDIRTGELCKDGGKSIRLPEQSFQILAMLLERPGEVVGREELRKRLWPNDTVVEFEHSISAAMNRLRQALGDSAGDPTYIETLARRGYRWMGSVEWVDNGNGPVPVEEPPATSASPPPSLIGRKVSHYRVLEFVGGGGMGIVYKAEDLKLARRVALKFLPEELTGDQHALERFEREARAASALNHPNICTIYEIDEDEGQPFIAMELLEGDTLRDSIGVVPNHRQLELPRLLDIAIQIASGLEAAHQKGIIHRDIKPSNIFITHGGAAKILDFGVAKLLESDEALTSQVQGNASSNTPQAETSKLRSLHLTRTGAALGTEGYMSPEQVRGEVLDARTDLFSFGLVLYEMATGHRAFGGDTVPALQGAILNQAPVPVRQHNPTLPRGLGQVIEKALEKNRESRYQSAGEMRSDLMRIADSHAASASRSRIWKVAAAIAVLVCAIVGGWIAKRTFSHSRSTSNPAVSSNIRTVPLTDLPGSAWGPVLSPDAKLFAFFWNGENPQRSDLYVQLVGAEKPLRLTHASSEYICCATWSPDGREIAFGRCDDPDKNAGAIFAVPALGGPERKLTDVVCLSGVVGLPTWTSDGSSLVLDDRCIPDGPTGITVFSLQTGEKRCLTKPPSDDLVDLYPALSPDQKTVAFARCDAGTSIKCDLYTVAVAGGNLRRLTTENNSIVDLVWTPDGKFVSFRSNRSGLYRSWRIPVAGGAIERETVNPELGPFSRDGRHMIYVEGSGTSSVWRADLSNAGGQVLGLKQMISGSYPDYNLQLSSDSREIVFTTTRTGHFEIGKANSDGSDAEQLTSFGGSAGSPHWSPDDRSIAFDYRPDTHGQIYVMDADGRNLHQLTSGNYDNVAPTWSRDGASIYFSSNRTGEDQIWRRDLKTGQEIQITRHGGQAALESFDGKTLYISKHEGGGIWSVPVTGGEELHLTEALHRGYWGYFAVTDSGLYLVDSEAKPGATIMYYSFHARRLTPVFTPKQNFVKWSPTFTASRDGRTLLFVQVESRTSLIMVEYLQ